MIGTTDLCMIFVFYKYIQDIFIILAVFLIPLRIDFYVIYKSSYFIQTGYPGLPITAFDIIFIIIFLHYVLQVVRKQEKLLLFPGISIPVFVFIFLTGISALYAQDRTLSFSNLILIVKSFFVFLYFANRIKTKKDVSLVVVGLILAVGLQGAVGIYQYVTGGEVLKGVFVIPNTSILQQRVGLQVISRVGGTIGHPNALGGYLSFCITMLIGYGFAKIQKQLGMLALISAFFSGILLLLTLSRGNWLAIGIGSGFLFYAIFYNLFLVA